MVVFKKWYTKRRLQAVVVYEAYLIESCSPGTMWRALLDKTGLRLHVSMRAPLLINSKVFNFLGLQNCFGNKYLVSWKLCKHICLVVKEIKETHLGLCVDQIIG